MDDDGEFALIARIAPHLKGAGDDAAVLDLDGAHVALAADAVVSGRHFRSDLSSLADVGWKALAVNLSDLAAMGDVTPRAALVTLLRPAGMSVDEVEELYAGLAEAATAFGVDLVGGDTCAAAELAVSVAVAGTMRSDPVWRSGARPGDRLVLVGALGGGAAALAQVGAGLDPDEALLAAHRRPQPLLRAGAVLAGHGATALIDISDGLGQDLGHVCRASNVAARVVWQAIPVAEGAVAAATASGHEPVELVCGGGEDYALLAALPPERAEIAAVEAGRADGVPAAVVGEVRTSEELGDPMVGLVLDNGSVRDIGGLGWDHFRTGQEGQ